MLIMIKKIFLLIILFIINTNNSFWYYTPNIDDNIKIYNLYEKIQNYIKKHNISWKNLTILRNKVKEKLAKQIDSFKKYTSFKEYAYIKLYKFFDYWDVFYNINNPIYYKVLENKYFKILVTNKKININDNSLYSKNWIKYITTITLKNTENIESYIKKNIILSNCKIVYNPKNFIRNIKYDFIILKPINKNSNCITTLDNYWIRYFIINKNKAFFINEWQDYNGIDFETFELKN